MASGTGRSNRPARGRIARLAAAVLLAAGLHGIALSGEALRISVLGPSDPFLEAAASKALSLALAKLEDPRCEQVFGDFRDASGRSLREKLETMGHTGKSFLEILRLADGDHLEPCQWTRILAATAPGSRVIRLCGLQFSKKLRRDPGFAAAILIHEELHCLGLGEDPPGSNEITARVIARCGR